MFIPRDLSEQIIEKLKLPSNKVILLYGARQLGKTTLSNRLLQELDYKILKINADQLKYHDVLSSRDFNKLKALVSGYELLFIDEAQKIQDLGINLKILHDELPELKILVTGSSSFKIANEVTESLTGRKWTYQLFPFSVNEIGSNKNKFEINDELENILIHGAYPEVYTTQNKKEKEDLLIEISDSYLYKDILELTNIKYPRKLRDILKLLAFQIGSEVSIHEISKSLSINRETVENYIDLLEKTFVIYRLSGFSRNLRKEVSKQDKFYFYDVGIRNAIIGNFNYLNNRNDIGALWENFIISERKKFLNNNNQKKEQYFWRTYTGAELDYIEEKGGYLNGFEIKFQKDKFKSPKAWKETYPNSDTNLINRNNYLEFLL